MTQTALILPLEPLDKSVEAFRCAYDPAVAQGLPAHITLIYPFMPFLDLEAETERTLEKILQQSAPFSYELNRVETFDEVAYLAPASDFPFLALIQSLTRAFPEYPPYGGAFETVIPHLTVGEKSCADRAAQEIELPVRGVANQVLMLRQSGEQWLTHKQIRFCGLA